MRPSLLLLLVLASPAQSGDCGSIMPAICAIPVEAAQSGRKVIRVAPSDTAYRIGDRLPIATRSILTDPARYSLPPSS